MPIPTTTEFLIVGGGIIGLAIARQLHRRGIRDVTIVDQGTCGREASWAAAGMLSPQAETDQVGPFFDFCSRSRDMYPKFAAELLDETGIDIDLDQTGTLYLAVDEESTELQHRYNWQADAGLAVEILSAEDIARIEPHLRAVTFGLRFPNDWQVDNRKLVQALRAFADLNGINVVENTPVDGLIMKNGHVVGVETAGTKIHSEHTVLTAGAWTSLIDCDGWTAPVEPIKGQIVCLSAPAGTLKHVISTSRGYLVPKRDGRILVGSTTEHTGFDRTTTREATERLTRLAAQLLPSSDLDVIDNWAGLRPGTPDGFPILGGIPGVEGLTVATGHYRNGILLTPATAHIVTERIADGVHAHEFNVFGVGRFASVVGASN